MSAADMLDPALPRDLAEEQEQDVRLRALRAAFGLPTLPPGTPNRARFVTVEPGGPVLAVLPREASR